MIILIAYVTYITYNQEMSALIDENEAMILQLNDKYFKI